MGSIVSKDQSGSSEIFRPTLDFIMSKFHLCGGLKGSTKYFLLNMSQQDTELLCTWILQLPQTSNQTIGLVIFNKNLKETLPTTGVEVNLLEIAGTAATDN